MYRLSAATRSEPESFELPFGGKLSDENRWVIMANLIPWEEFEEEYAKSFSENKGAPALPFRMAMSALIIQERLGISDRETVEQIRENPYLQYFIGLTNYQTEAPFDASMMVYFRKRIKLNVLNKINQEMVKKGREILEDKESGAKAEEPEEESEQKNKGKLILDATCAPADIKYPRDLDLLNQARQGTEKILDCLYQEVKEKLTKKPRTSRKIARKNYLKVAKKRRPSQKERRKAIGQQLGYIQRNLVYIDQLIELGASLTCLSKRLYKLLLVIEEVSRQQREMWSEKKTRVDQRIVSLSQPHVRPIVRGKAGKPTEFGAKLSVSCVDNYVFLHRLSWENFNESQDLKAQVENFKETYGCYPESVHVDKIYRTRENLAWCKARGIRISGPKLGRPPKNVSEQEKKQAQEDESFRNAIEGKFGQAKRRFSLNLIMTKLPETSETSIAITFLVVNLSQLLRQFFGLFLSVWIFSRTNELKCPCRFDKNYVKSRFTKVKLITWATNYWHLIA
ncbi:MAG: IS5 family transposase [Microcystis aeruginosa]